MKKTYQKPQIMFEDFSLSTNIAGDCEVRTHTPARHSCAYTVTDEFGDTSHIFMGDMVGICSTTQQDDGSSGFCYHVPFENNTLFNS